MAVSTAERHCAASAPRQRCLLPLSTHRAAACLFLRVLAFSTCCSTRCAFDRLSRRLRHHVICCSRYRVVPSCVRPSPAFAHYSRLRVDLLFVFSRPAAPPLCSLATLLLRHLRCRFRALFLRLPSRHISHLLISALYRGARAWQHAAHFYRLYRNMRGAISHILAYCGGYKHEQRLWWRGVTVYMAR